MTLKFNVPGKKRKELAATVSAWLDYESVYAGAPTFAYKIGGCTIDKDGNLNIEGLDDDTAELLIEHLFDEGFECESVNGTPTTVSIEVPMSVLTESGLENVRALVEAKSALIKKALGVERLPVSRIGDVVEFNWFPYNASPDENKAYLHFVSALCNLAKQQKRVNAVKDKEVDNERYAFRCFLLRLGFIGEQYKTERKILLRNLEGSSAFKSGTRKEAED